MCGFMSHIHIQTHMQTVHTLSSTCMFTDVMCQQSRIRRNDRHYCPFSRKPVLPVEIPFVKFPQMTNDTAVVQARPSLKFQIHVIPLTLIK